MLLQKIFHIIGQHPKYTIIAIFLSIFGGINVLAFQHAYKMLNFIPQGRRTSSPESLSLREKFTVLLFGITIPKPVNTHTPAALGVQFETHVMQVEPGIELEAWYIPHSQASGIILLCHGYSASKSDVLSEALAFHEMGYTTVLIDFRGCGGSSGDTTSIGFYEADDVTCAVDYIQRTFQDVPLILYGQSMGSAAILRAISTHAIQPEALILEAVFDKMLSTVKNRFSAMGLPSFPGAHLLVFWGGLQQGFWGFAHNPVTYATRVQCPVLMLHGKHDPRATLPQARTVFDHLPGEKQLVCFEKAGHESYLSIAPEQWKTVVSQFLHRYIQ